jgi:putative spermidine/putrescine transport system ATP-binding protein
MAYVQLRNLSKSFGGRPAVRDFSLEIERGELISLLGPSGCGKTTTLRMLAGFEAPDSGTITIAKEDILQVPAQHRRMGVVFQNYALFPHLSARNNIAFGMKIARQPAKVIGRRVAELLRMIGLEDVGHKVPRELSGGQQQRIALARALAVEPRMLLLDEPLSALDAVVRVSLRDEIRRIQSSLGVTTLYVTHDQEEALAISDRIVVMRDGVIEQVGSSEEIYAQPASPFVAGFIGKMNQLPGRVEQPSKGQMRCGPHLLRVLPQAIAHLPSGTEATILLRPEAITIAPADTAPSAGDNRLTARIEIVTFLGSVRRIGLEAGAQHVIADVSTASGWTFQRGDLVALDFPVDACRVIVHNARESLRE